MNFFRDTSCSHPLFGFRLQLSSLMAMRSGVQLVYSRCSLHRCSLYKGRNISGNIWPLSSVQPSFRRECPLPGDRTLESTGHRGTTHVCIRLDSKLRPLWQYTPLLYGGHAPRFARSPAALDIPSLRIIKLPYL